MKRVAIVGTQGVPARYGGFETMVENIIGENCPSDIRYTVFCSSRDMASSRHLRSYKGVELKYIPLHANGMQSIPYDIWSLCLVIRGYDAVLVLGTSGCSFLPLFRLFCRSRLIVNIDGLEHRRAKWGRTARAILRFSERMAVKYADVIIADNKGVQDYVKETYGIPSELVAYGGDHVLRTVSPDMEKSVLDAYGLRKYGYAISICRIEPENNCHVILDAFENSDLTIVMIGNWRHSEYSRMLRDKYSGKGNVIMIDSLYDIESLAVLRSCARYYIHGHSAGGTNPSLVEAMFFGRPILSFDVVYNRETTCNMAYYWRNAHALKDLVDKQDLDGSMLKSLAENKYLWKTIAEQYAALY